MRLLKWALTLFSFAACFLSLQRLFIPKHAQESYEGALIGEYYGEAKDHDVIIIGDCEVYSNISPVALWEGYGIASFVRGSPQQLIWQSYYLLEETFRHEKPVAVVFNVMSMQYGKPRDEAYNRLTLDGMRLSDIKLRSAYRSMTKGENLLSYVFPLLRYHDRWSSLKTEDFQYFFSGPKVSINGFMINCGVKPIDIAEAPAGMKLPDYAFSAESYEYLDKIRTLCERNGAGLLLVKAPVLYPVWHDQWDSQIDEYAKKHGIVYVNYLKLLDETGIDFTKDTFNAGNHLNVYGAKKLTEHLGKVLASEFNLTDRRNEPETAARWAKKSKAYADIIAAQEAEFKLTEKIKTILVR